MGAMVEFRGLTLKYRWEGYERSIFNDLSFKVPSGSFLSITGGNGSGKSSLLKLILGLISADSGEIVVDGQSIQQGYAAGIQKNQLAYLAQRIESLFFGDTVKQELNYRGQLDSKLLLSMLDEIQLEHLLERDIETLSGGERQGVALIQFLASQAPLLILDEPSSYLDNKKSEYLRLKLANAHGEGRTILHATQFEEEVAWGSHLLDLSQPIPEIVQL